MAQIARKNNYTLIAGGMGGQRDVPVDCGVRHFPDA